MSSPETLDLDALLDKLSKLQALSQRGGTLHEAEVAASKMAELMTRYNISLMQLETHATGKNRAVASDRFELSIDRWRIELLFTVAEAHHCKAVRLAGHLRHTRHKCAMIVVGHAHNLIVVRETWLWLQREAERLAREGHAAATAIGDAAATARPYDWRRDFKLGVVVGLRSAYHRVRASLHAELGTTWGLVPLLEAEVERHYGELFPETQAMRGPGKVGFDAYAAGKRAGEAINLDRQVGGGPAAAALAS